MDKVFARRADLCDIAGWRSVSFQPAQLCTVLAQATSRATQTGQATLVSLVVRVPASDPLRVLQALQQLYPGQCFYWEQPSRQMALVGAGTTLKLETHGTARFNEAALAVRALSAEAVVAYDPALTIPVAGGPVLFGGFSFDPLNACTPLWRDFPAGLLMLPTLLFRQHQQQTTLTLSQMVQASDDLDGLSNGMSRQVAAFAQLVRALPERSGSLTVGIYDSSQPMGPPPDCSVTTDKERQEYRVQDLWSAREWKSLVGRTVHEIQQGAFAKVVLARAARVVANEQPFTLAATLQQLRQNYPAANVFAFQRGTRAFLGATPERLMRAHNGRLHTMALAGSAPRGSNEAEDRLLGSELLHSAKNRQEHEIVTNMIRAALARLCARVWIADTPELLRLKNIQHLRTAIVGELLPERCILEALQSLHPTPAVGGSPTEAALAYIRAHEHLDRGWYAGPIGWVDLQGNGEFAVALRSALLEPDQATLFAGCGIVADSEPEAEYAESCLKLQVMLRSLSGEE